jgi:hypothetical protein
VPAEISIALIVGQNEDNIGPLLFLCRLCRGAAEDKKEKQKVTKWFHRA